MITLIGEKLFPLADRCEQRDQLPQLCFVEMAELPAMDLVNPLLHLAEQMQSASRDFRHYVAPVLAAPLTDDQLRLFEPIEKTRYVGNLADEPLRDLVSTKTIRFRPAQNAENVVLRRRYVMRLQRRLERVLQQRGGPLDAQVSFLLQTFEGPHLFQFYL